MTDRILNRDPVPLFSALGDRTRLIIMTELADSQAYSITKLANGFGMTRQAVTKHLRVLEDAGLVTSERVGRQSLYQIAPDGLQAARSFLDRVLTHWNAAIEHVEDLSDEA